MTRLGAAILLAAGAIALDLCLLSVLRIEWTRTSVLISIIPFWCIAGLLVRRIRREGRSCGAVGLSPPGTGDEYAESPVGSSPPLHRTTSRGEIVSSLAGRAFPYVFDALTIAIVVAYAIFATWASPYEWDFYGIWGSKARAFFEAEGMTWEVLRTVEKPDYPPLIPLLFDFVAVVTGGWNDRVFGWIYVGLCASVIAIARGMFAEEVKWPSLATLAVAFPALNLWVGLAEAGVMAFGCAGVLFIRRGNVGLGAVFLGLAAWSKNEGLALIAVSAVALFLATRSVRRVLQLWPAVAVIAPWLITRSALNLSTDFMEGSMTERVFERLGKLGEVARAFAASPPDQPWFWLAVLVTVVVFLREAVRRELFLLLVVVLQLGLMVAQALATKWDLAMHVSLTMNRLPHQIAPLAAFLAVVLLMPVILSERTTRAARLRVRNGIACLPRGRPLIRLRHLLPSAEGRRVSVGCLPRVGIVRRSLPNRDPSPPAFWGGEGAEGG